MVRPEQEALDSVVFDDGEDAKLELSPLPLHSRLSEDDALVTTGAAPETLTRAPSA